MVNNIPYTHSEDKPSPQLLSKSAIGFAHTGLLFLLARTPGASIIKEIKPGAMIGFKRLGETHVRLRGDRGPAFLIEPREETLGEKLDTHQPADSYRKFEGRDVPLKIIGADTGENGFFTIGEFQAITFPRRMGYVTPEAVARTTILEILGASARRRRRRRPRINTPPAPPDTAPAAVDRDAVEKYPRTGWVDLRRQNFQPWRERIERLWRSHPEIVAYGSAACDATKYNDDRFVP